MFFCFAVTEGIVIVDCCLTVLSIVSSVGAPVGSLLSKEYFNVAITGCVYINGYCPSPDELHSLSARHSETA